MKKVIFILFLVFSISVQAQNDLIGSIRPGFSIKQNLFGFGASALISKEIKPSFFVSFTAGYYNWGKDFSHPIYPTTLISRIEEPSQLIPFGLGIKYFFGHSHFVPYVTAEWGMNFYKLKTVTYQFDPSIGSYANPKTSNDSNLFASSAIGMGALLKIGDGLFADFAFLTLYSEEGQFINFSTGLAYQL